MVPAAHLKKSLAAFIAEEGKRVVEEEGLAGFCAVFEGALELPGKLPMQRVCSLSGLFVAQTSGERPPGSQTVQTAPSLRSSYIGSCLTQHVLDNFFVDSGGFDDPVRRLFLSLK